MAADFPTNVVNLPNKSDGEKLYAVEYNKIVDEITAIETELKKSAADTIVQAADSAKLGGVAAASFLQTPAWQAYTPAWTAASTNPALGNGTLTGRYVLFGKTAMVVINLIMGSTTTYGDGAWSLSLPVAAASSVRFGGVFAALDSGTANYEGTVFTTPGSNLLGFFVRDGGSNFLSPALTHAWAAGDSLYIALTYETV